MKPFKFVSLNLWIGGILFDNMAAFLKGQGADILALQEVYDGGPMDGEKRLRSFTVLKELLGFPYAVFSPAFFTTINGFRVDSGNAVFSRFPITGASVTFFDVPYREADTTDPGTFPYIARNLQHVILDCEGAPLHIFNTQGIWGTDGADNDRRLAMSRIIAEQVRSERNAILSGDFNVDINTESIRIIERHLTNVFKGKLKTTFNMKRKDNSKLATAVIDMVFAGKGIRVQKAFAPEVDVSDHRPLGIVFDIE